MIRRFRSSLAPNSIERISSECIQVVHSAKVGKKAIAKKHLVPGTVINQFQAPVCAAPTMHTVCLSENIHVAPTFGAECVSHACGVDTPNVAVRIHQTPTQDGGVFVAQMVVTKEVKEGADLFFNYCSTEWYMSSPFDCQCPQCQERGESKRVQGFSYLPFEEQQVLKKDASPFILSLFHQQQQQKVHKQHKHQQSSSTSSSSPSSSSEQLLLQGK